MALTLSLLAISTGLILGYQFGMLWPQIVLASRGATPPKRDLKMGALLALAWLVFVASMVSLPLVFAQGDSDRFLHGLIIDLVLSLGSLFAGFLLGDGKRARQFEDREEY